MKKYFSLITGLLLLASMSFAQAASYVLRAPSPGLQPTPATAPAPASGDPYWSDVGLLMHFNGTNGSTSFIDQAGNTVTNVGSGPVISTVDSEFNGSSGYFNGTSGYLEVPQSANMVFGTGDFTVEFWAKLNTTSSTLYPEVIDWRQAGGGGVAGMSIYFNSGNLHYASAGGTDVIVTPAQANAWAHYAISRQSGTVRVFINGQQVATASDSTNYASTGTYAFIGAAGPQNNYFFSGYLQELRITRGVARYTANFTAPTQPFPNQ